MNKMKEVAELLGVQLGEEFNIKNLFGKYKLNSYGLYDADCGEYNTNILMALILGDYEIIKPILDKEEKKYLESVLRPFSDRVESIWKNEKFYNDCEEHITIICKNDGYCMNFPYFRKDSMYKGMELNKRYTLEELGLFDESIT